MGSVPITPLPALNYGGLGGQAMRGAAHAQPRVVAADLHVLVDDLARAIRPRMFEVQADQRVARLDSLHAAALEPFAELAIEPAVAEPFVEAVHREHFIAPRR